MLNNRSNVKFWLDRSNRLVLAASIGSFEPIIISFPNMLIHNQ
jgi:hypothetical protein